MSLTIDAVEFDSWEGTIVLAKRRVVTFAPSDRQHIGAQILPKVGRPFSFVTRRYTAQNDRTTFATDLDAKVGTIVPIVLFGLAFASSPYLQKFLVLEPLEHSIDVSVAFNGYRGTTFVNHEPAGVIETKWMLQAVPAS